MVCTLLLGCSDDGSTEDAGDADADVRADADAARDASEDSDGDADAGDGDADASMLDPEWVRITQVPNVATCVPVMSLRELLQLLQKHPPTPNQEKNVLAQMKGPPRTR